MTWRLNTLAEEIPLQQKCERLLTLPNAGPPHVKVGHCQALIQESLIVYSIGVFYARFEGMTYFYTPMIVRCPGSPGRQYNSRSCPGRWLQSTHSLAQGRGPRSWRRPLPGVNAKTLVVGSIAALSFVDPGNDRGSRTLERLIRSDCGGVQRVVNRDPFIRKNRTISGKDSIIIYSACGI